MCTSQTGSCTCGSEWTEIELNGRKRSASGQQSHASGQQVSTNGR
ncbi:hypothetical protein ACFPYN_04075 [Paenisporosarcina macmurdoensis]|uniref:Uncharacterized protein n=1 Tax=Paenisporosarcina macmurdoensis TaxID=212659 RepID=A0ABW1L677_9BACL